MLPLFRAANLWREIKKQQRLSDGCFSALWHYLGNVFFFKCFPLPWGKDCPCLCAVLPEVIWCDQKLTGRKDQTSRAEKGQSLSPLPKEKTTLFISCPSPKHYSYLRSHWKTIGRDDFEGLCDMHLSLDVSNLIILRSPNYFCIFLCLYKFS